MKKGFLKFTFVLAFLIMVLPIKVNALTFKDVILPQSINI